MTTLFNRSVSLTLAEYVDGSFSQTKPNAVVVRDLRAYFVVEKSLEDTPNTCEITVNNLAEETRTFLQKRPLHVRLDAGYADQLSRLFSGDAILAHSRRDGTEWLSKLQIRDGGRAHRHARVRRSYKTKVDARTALRDVAESMGLKLPKSLDDVKELLAKFQSGLVLDGPSAEQMTRLLDPYDRQWSIQDGSLQVLASGETRGGEAILISQSTGMIGSPDRSSPKKEKEGPTLTVETLLDPRLTPGCRIKVESRSVSGVFRVERVRHVGDTHGQQWTTTVEAK